MPTSHDINYLDHVSDGVIVIDEQFTIVFANQVFLNWVGAKPNHFVGQPLQLAFPELTKKRFWARFQRLFTLRAPMMISTLLHKSFVNIFQSNGELMMQDTTISVVKTAKGLQGVISINNVTEQNKSMLRVKDSAKQVEQLADSKLQFLSTISHDIRNPLNGIIGSTELLLDQELNNEQSRLVNGIKDSGDFLLALIKDFVDLTRLTSNQLRLSPETIVLKEFLHNVIGLFEVEAKNKGLRFVYELDFDYEQTLYIDKSRLYQIVENLVSNAIKFTNQGQVKMAVSANDGALSIVVEDSGVGIAEDQIASIFDSFTQAHESRDVDVKGFGLGLTIVKSVIELLEGTIEVESQLGKGTTFKVNIPLVQPPSDKQLDSDINEVPPDLKGKHIFVAEDDNISLHIIRSFIEKLGGRVTTASDGLVACNRLKENTFDIVLLDDNMPFKNGCDVFTFAKTHAKFQAIPFVITSGNALVEDNERYLKHGFDFLLPKPYCFADVVALFNKVLLWES